MRTAPSLPDRTSVSEIALTVGDLAREVRFYTHVLGLDVVDEPPGSVRLGAGDRAFLRLDERAGAPPAPGATGLFHFAILCPTRRDLASVASRLVGLRHPLQGAADHLVSEAVYLADPEGNGLEFYVDRPRHVWHSVEGGIFMTTEPLDVPGLLMAAPGPAAGLPPGTVVGHVHLRVASLAASEEFYGGQLGFEVTSRAFPGALFVAAGGYHHHVGLNVWGGPHAPPREGSAGLMSFDLIVSPPEARERMLGGGDEGMLVDPDRIGVRIARP